MRAAGFPTVWPHSSCDLSALLDAVYGAQRGYSGVQRGVSVGWGDGGVGWGGRGVGRAEARPWRGVAKSGVERAGADDATLRWMLQQVGSQEYLQPPRPQLQGALQGRHSAVPSKKPCRLPLRQPRREARAGVGYLGWQRARRRRRIRWG